MPRRLVACAVLLCAAASANAADDVCVAGSARRVIKFYEYGGANATDATPMFLVFRKVVDEEVFALNSLGGSSRPDPLKTEPTPGTNTPFAHGQLDPAASLTVMKTDPRLLELLDGRMQRGAKPQTFLIHSDIYIWPPSGAASVQPIGEDFLLEPKQHDLARSIHLAATYYALAIDAGRNSCRKTQVSLLAKAEETLQDVPSEFGTGANSLMKLVHDAQRSLGLIR